ncbi:MAG: Bacterial Ig-like domain (group 2) [Tenericutes bacterium ADurb.Bin024]|nr:MAG: Bacterial Ig-like domain (group 2) [Tenericutes bacterium ADurb.Bin024]
MKWLKRNIRYFVLSLFLLTNGLIIFEATLSGTPSGARSSFVSLILSIFVNKTVDGPEAQYVPVESLTLTTCEDTTISEGMHYYIPLGITRRINTLVLPENATEKGVTWTTSDGNVLEVYPGGYLEARALGANILVTASTAGIHHRVTFYVTVHEKIAPPFYEIALSKSTITIDTTSQIEVNVDESVANEYDTRKLGFYAEDESIAVVNKHGVIRGVSVGETFVGVKGDERKFKVKVTNNETPLIAPTAITLDFSETGYVYDKIPLNYTFDVDNVTDPSLTFVSSNDIVATVIKEHDHYFIKTPKISGTATITAYLNTDFTISATKNIVVNNVMPTAINFKNVPTELITGQRINVSYDLSHSLPKSELSVTDKRVTFTSSDNTIARVSTGNMFGTIVAFKEGTVTIRATSVANPTISAAFTLKIIPRAFINDDNFSDFQGFVRKAIGHFFLFFVDGVFGFLTFYLFLKDKIKSQFIVLISIATGVIFAALSEILQLFVPDRAGAISDVIIDSAGYITATFLMLLIVHLINQFKTRKKVQ